MSSQFATLLTLTLLFAALAWLGQRRHRVTVREARGRMFQDCLELFDDRVLTQDDIDFPVLTGRYRGHRVRIQPIADHVGLRKIPSLWLLVTVYGRLPVSGVIDYLVRPQHIEFFSPVADLPVDLPIPPDWPQHAMLRTDRPGTRPTLERLGPHVRWFQEESKAKELLVTPKGVRIVFQAYQARRPHYLVLRGVTFDTVAVPRELLLDLLDRAVAVYQDLSREVPHATEVGACLVERPA